MGVIEALVEPQGSVILGWVAPSVMYARLERTFSAELAVRFAARFSALVDTHTGVQYFYDASSVESYELGALDILRDSLLAHKSQYQRIVARPWQDTVSDKAREFAVALGCLEYVTGTAEFEACLRAMVPAGSARVPLLRSRMRNSSTALARPEVIAFIYTFDLRDFEQGIFAATHGTHLSVRPHDAWVCVARDHGQALKLAQQAAVNEWDRPLTRNPASFTVVFSEIGDAADAGSTHMVAPRGLTQNCDAVGILERLTDAHGSAIVGRIEEDVVYARVSAAVSSDLGIRIARRLSCIIGEHVGVRLFLDLNIATFDIEAFVTVVDLFLEKRDQLELMVLYPGAIPLRPQSRALPTFLQRFDHVLSTAEFEKRLRDAVSPTTFQHLMRASHHAERKPSSPPRAKAHVGATYTYVFDLRDFEGGRFVASRFAHLAVRSSTSWLCKAASDAEALALARQAAIVEWPMPHTRQPEQFTVRFIEPPTESGFDWWR